MAALGAILVDIISIIGEWFLVKIKWIDLKKIRKFKKKIEEFQKEMKENKIDFRNPDPKKLEKMRKLQQELLSSQMEIMKEKLKISLITMLPVFLVFTYIYKVEGGFGWWFLTYILVYFITDKLLRLLAKKMKIDIDY